jgi:hypothetical protein
MGSPGPQNKVQRVIAEYDLEGLGAELERRWTAPSEADRSSLRELATEVNRRILRAALESGGENPLEGAVDNLYRLLTEEAVSPADRTRAERRLERSDVDVDALRSDFVSYQAVRTYLTEVRGAEYERETPDDLPGRTAERIEQLRSRLVTVAQSKLGRLAEGEDLRLGEFRVTADVQVYCEDCGEQYDVATLLEEGGCACEG